MLFVSVDMENDNTVASEELSPVAIEANLSVNNRTAGRRIVDFAGVVNVTDQDELAFTMDDIKDAVISKRTFASYVGPIHKFLKYCAESVSAPYCDVLTDYGRENVRLLEPNEQEKVIPYNARRVKLLQSLLREASVSPLFDVHILTGDDMMNYFLKQKGSRTGKMLSRAMFSQHRSAINHLYRCHNRSGFPNIASDHLKTLFKGLHRSFAKRKNRWQ
jgi:hypothetical protein